MKNMDIKISTKNELTARSKELEIEFNKIRDELAEYIESTHTVIEEKTNRMDELSEEYKQITEELNKRDGNASAKR